MPKGPKGEKCPADVIGAAVKVMKIATGVIARAQRRRYRSSHGGLTRDHNHHS